MNRLKKKTREIAGITEYDDLFKIEVDMPKPVIQLKIIRNSLSIFTYGVVHDITPEKLEVPKSIDSIHIQDGSADNISGFSDIEYIFNLAVPSDGRLHNCTANSMHVESTEYLGKLYYHSRGHTGNLSDIKHIGTIVNSNGTIKQIRSIKNINKLSNYALGEIERIEDVEWLGSLKNEGHIAYLDNIENIASLLNGGNIDSIKLDSGQEIFNFETSNRIGILQIDGRMDVFMPREANYYNAQPFRNLPGLYAADKTKANSGDPLINRINIGEVGEIRSWKPWHGASQKGVYPFRVERIEVHESAKIPKELRLYFSSLESVAEMTGIEKSQFTKADRYRILDAKPSELGTMDFKY